MRGGERLALYGHAALVILKPLDVRGAVARQPCLHLGPLTVGLLAFGGRNAQLDGGAHGASRSASRVNTSIFS